MFGSAANKTIDLLSDSSVGLSVMTHHRGTTNVEFGIRPNVSFEPGLLGRSESDLGLSTFQAVGVLSLSQNCKDLNMNVLLR